VKAQGEGGRDAQGYRPSLESVTEVSGASVAGVFDPGRDRFAVPGLKEAGYSASCR